MYRSIRDQSVTGVYPIAGSGRQPFPVRLLLRSVLPPPSMLLPMPTTVDPHRTGDRQDVYLLFSGPGQAVESKQGKVLPNSLSPFSGLLSSCSSPRPQPISILHVPLT